MAAPPGTLKLLQKLIDDIRVSSLFDQLIAAMEQSIEHQPIF
jgi:hypothetical protein